MEFTYAYFMQCNMTYGAGLRVGWPSCTKVLSLCKVEVQSVSIELCIYQRFYNWSRGWFASSGDTEWKRGLRSFQS